MSKPPKYVRYQTNNPPCLDCKKRKVGCHCKCEDYKKYTSELKHNQESFNKLHKAKILIEDSISNQLEKQRRRKGNV